MRRLLPLVSAVVVVDTMLYAALVPLLPHFEHRYGLTKGGVGALAAAYAIGTLVGGVPAGIVSARFGARPALGVLWIVGPFGLGRAPRGPQPLRVLAVAVRDPEFLSGLWLMTIP